ncbi:MAG: hypothetical protein FWC46_01870 [Actinomycetia bacterium]|nr:hypothetical protein [Actinomycetes bacterium]
MSMDTLETIFAPGMRHWREYQEFQNHRVLVMPALDKGPVPGRVHVDYTTRQVVIDPDVAPVPAAPPAPAWHPPAHADRP